MMASHCTEFKGHKPMTTTEQAAMNVARRIHSSHPQNSKMEFLTFFQRLAAICNGDVKTRELVSTAVEVEYAHLMSQQAQPVNANSCFDRMFDRLRAARPNASGVEVFKSVDAPRHNYSEIVRAFTANMIKR